MAAIVAVLFKPFLDWRVCYVIGLAFAAGHFHGREKRDYEMAVNMPPPHLDGYYSGNGRGMGQPISGQQRLCALP